MLTGRFVFESTNPVEICAQHLSAIPEPPSSLTECDVNPGLERVIMQCLEKKRGDRPASGAEIAEQLQGLAVDPWSQRHAAQWWETEGNRIIMSRDSDAEVGSLATIRAERVVTDT